MKNLLSKNPNITFFFLLSIISLFYNSYSIIFKTTYSIHQWRQADCLSITDSYYEDNAPFTEPHIHWIGKNNDNKTISEFPLIYYSVAQIWKITGKKEFIFRLIDLSIVILALFLLFRVLLSLIGDPFWAILIPIFLYTSQILVYYANNFLMNAPAFGIMLIAWFFFWKFNIQKRNIYIIISMLLFLLAGLLKITALISFVAILIISLAKLIHFPYFKKIKIHTNLIYYLSFSIVLIGIPIWYNYTRHYNNIHLPYIFLQDIFPIWELSPEKQSFIWHTLTHDLLPKYFNIKALYVLLFGFIFTIIDYKKASKFWVSLGILVILGSISYIILWYQAFDVHDYYLTNLLVVVIVLAIGIIVHLKNNYPAILNNKIIKYSIAVLVIVIIYDTLINNRVKYKADDYFVINSPFFNKDRKKDWDYYHSHYKTHFKALNELEPVFKEIGIKKSDTVVSLPDNSINISLYLMDRNGFTGYGYNSIPDSIKLEYFRSRGAKYLILNDTNFSSTSWINQLSDKKIRTYKNVNIYDLR